MAESQAEQTAKSGAMDYLSVTIAGQLFGIPVLQIEDVLGAQKVTKVPLAPPEVSGALNLRGRIVTALNVRERLKLEDDSSCDSQARMSVVVEQNGELYSLLIDGVGDVLSMAYDEFGPNPVTMDPILQDVSEGIFQMEDELMIILDVSKLLDQDEE